MGAEIVKQVRIQWTGEDLLAVIKNCACDKNFIKDHINVKKGVLKRKQKHTEEGEEPLAGELF